MRLAPRRRRGRSDSGVTAVEFAIVVPVLLLLILGMLEFAFVMRDYLSVRSATSVGARTASTGASAGPGTCPGLPVCSPANPSTYDYPALAQGAADAIQQAGSAMPQDYVDYLLVYESNDKGYPGAAGNTTMPTMAQCGTSPYVNCVAFKWAKAIDRFVYVGGTWNSSTIYACPPSASNVNGPDAVGVFMHATHPYLSGLFGKTLSITEKTVLQFEPLPINQCAGGQHQ